jgi:DNA-binding Lrp family transcriptional regulator
MQTTSFDIDTGRYERCIKASRRIRWDIDDDVIRGREFDLADKFLPDGLSLVNEIPFLTDDERRYLSQVQGRTYANIFGLVERFINAKVLEISRDHWLGDQTALEALIRFSDEELKHQELFRRIERLAARGMPRGYTCAPDPNDVASAVLSKSTWAVLGLTCHIELFTQAHYKQSIAADDSLSELFRDVFLFHWKEESQHAILDELEWRREHARMSDEERDRAVDDLIELVGAVDGILQVQADADGNYFCTTAGRPFTGDAIEAVKAALLKAYRWQYIVSGVQDPRFMGILDELTTGPQMERIVTALTPLLEAGSPSPQARSAAAA